MKKDKVGYKTCTLFDKMRSYIETRLPMEKQDALAFKHEFEISPLT